MKLEVNDAMSTHAAPPTRDEMWGAVECGAGAGGGPAPCARGKHAAALLGAHVYVLGGRGAGGALPLRDFWRYSLAEGQWERLSARGAAPPALQEHSATAHAGRLYVFGGEAGALSAETPLWILDTQTLVWRKLAGAPPAPAPTARAPRAPRAAGPSGRRGHSAHALKDCLLVYGGYKDLRGSTNELWAFHYESETWQQVRTGVAGPARHRHAAALHGARLYVHGGACDLRACADLWHYDTLSRVWTAVRVAARAAPGARSGHAGLRAGAHLYIFGGELAAGHVCSELWRFHFATETWERMEQSLQWPSPRVDSQALLVCVAPRRVRSAPAGTGGAGAGGEGARPAEPPPSLLREISKLSSFHLRRAARCSYSMLAAASERDSTESLVRSERALAKSHSAYGIRAGAGGAAGADAGGHSPREADEAGERELAREPASVPDLADMALPAPALSPAEATRLVYFDSDEEEDIWRDASPPRPTAPHAVALPKSASVRFTRLGAATVTTTAEDEAELSTSDYASAERVNRLSGAELGFSNPHYLGPDVRKLGIALTPDSGVGPGDIELQDLGARRAGGGATAGVAGGGASALHLLLLGGKEPPHAARLHGPMSVWTYRLL